MSQPQNKQQIILAAIREGGATRESLMEAADVNRAGLASQLAYLNARGLAMAEVDPTKAEFPLTNDDGVFYIGGHDAYQAKRTAAPRSTRTHTVSEITELAQRREDRASSGYARAQKRAEENPEDAILQKTAEMKSLELEIASLKLGAVQSGNYQYETGTIVPDGDSDVDMALDTDMAPEATSGGPQEFSPDYSESPSLI